MSNYQDHISQKTNGRLCVVCGAKVTNINQKANVCSPLCTHARDYNISRERAIKLFPEIAESEVHALNYISLKRKIKT